MTQHEPKQISISQITENIWVGNRACCMMHGKAVHGVDFDAEIDLDNETALERPQERKIYLWLPIPDRTVPTDEQIKVGVQALTTMVQDGLKVYVHCQWGFGRSPFLVIRYLMSQGMPVAEALALLKQKRPGLDLSEAQEQALTQLHTPAEH